MKQSTFAIVLIVAAFASAVVIFYFLLPDFITAGGPLVIALIALSIMVFTYIVERILTLNKAKGRGSLPMFLKNVQKNLSAGDVDAAMAACDQQHGSLANIIRSGLERYKVLTQESRGLQAEKQMAEIQRAIEEATSLETPLLERNLIALSTIASIATMFGLLGTVIGMIRAFTALAAAGGAPDAIQLSIGISEALINTALGLLAAIIGIVAYNFFVTKVDNFTYMIDEASYNVVQILHTKTLD